jgi:AcrR family transcriptional regulator
MKTLNQRPDKRQKIIEAATQLFSRTHDYRRVSLETIAQEAGVSPTTIYNYFGDRETLVYEVVKQLLRQSLKHNQALIRSKMPFSQKIASIVSGKVDMTEKLNQEIIEKLVSQDKRIEAFIDKLYDDEVKPLWLEMLADGKKQGYIDESLDEEAILVYLDILKAGVRSRPDLLDNFKSNLGLVESLTRIVFYGLLKKDCDLFQKKGE